MNYIKLKQKGILSKRALLLDKLLEKCSVCPRNCQVNRKLNEKGHCKSGYNPIISSYSLHHGEEPPISGFRGSGTIFFTNCNLNCCFCQNYPISQLGNGNEITIQKLSDIMIQLQEQGAHNVNLVTPTHFVPQIVMALCLAIDRGFKIPLVYNSGGYEAVSTLKLLDGIIDIYLPDMKYSDEGCSIKYSNAPAYPEINKKAVIEMYRQVGNLQFDRNRIATKGLLLRHLVLPDSIAGSEKSLKFISEKISKNTYISIMAQYHPAYEASESSESSKPIFGESSESVKSVMTGKSVKSVMTDNFSELSRRVTAREYNNVKTLAEKLGLNNGWHQEL